MRSIFLAFIAFVSLNVMAVTPKELENAIHFKVEKYELKNGLVVILQPDNTIPAVSVNTWFRVGSKDEKIGRTGIAHFFEHMMFKGTKKYPKDTWGKFLNSKGADTNAFTSNDYTGYYINAPAEHLELLLDIESDRMRNLLLDPKEVTSEREVVKEERRMRYEDSIEGSIREKMAALMYKILPYRWLTIGSMEDLNAASMEDLHKFYKSFYSPNNAVLVVAGDIDVEKTKDLINKYYGNLPRESIVRPEIGKEPVQTKERQETIVREAQTPTVAIAYPTPDFSNQDMYALDLLSILLGQGESSRLYKKLVRQEQSVLAIHSGSWSQALGSQFSINASLKPGGNPQKVIASIEKEVRGLRDKTISQKELDKARNLFLKDQVDELKRISGRARTLAYYEAMFGDYGRVFSDLKKYFEVTPADIHRVAKLYLKPEQRNTIIVVPQEKGGKS